MEEEKKRAEEAQNHKRKDTDDLKTLKRRKEELENELDDLKDSVTQVCSGSNIKVVVFLSLVLTQLLDDP